MDYSAATTVRTDFRLALEPEAVLRAQGVDPARLSPLREALLETARQAVEIAMPLLAPAAACRRLGVTGLVHTRLELEGGTWLKGELIASQLAGARWVTAAACTVGGRVSEEVRRIFPADPALALALDAAASAAVEGVAAQLCAGIEAQAAAEGLVASLPLNPGLEGWPVEVGQPQLFALLDGVAAGIRLNAACLMIPEKSVSFVVGAGESLARGGSSCDFCSLAGSCRYRRLSETPHP